MALLYLVGGVSAHENLEAVSPGNELRVTVIDQICPTFSWAQVPGAETYQIAVFEMREPFEGLSYYESQAALSQPVLMKKISGTASSWTPSLEEALNNGGRYVWFVQSQDAYGSGTWSAGKKFAVRASLSLTEIKEKIRDQLKSHGIEEEVIDEAFQDISSQDKKSKSSGKLKSKALDEEKERNQIKSKSDKGKELKSKLNQIIAGSSSFSAGALGNEGDTQNNVYYGNGAGHSISTYAWYNSFIGINAGYSDNSGAGNNFIGFEAGYSNTSGNFNIFLGANTGYYNTTGSNNTFIGNANGYANSEGSNNIFIGFFSGTNNTNGNNNIFLGNETGYSNTTGAGNVFLGYKAGYNETGSHKLYIENSDSSSPLIYGEFDNDRVTINGTFNVTESNINVDTTAKRARFKLQADGGGTNPDDYFNFTMRNDYGDVTLSVWDDSASGWLPMLSYEYLNNKVDFKDNDIVTTGTISSGGGAYTSGGAWIEASSRDYKENIMELDQAESLKALASLNPVRYNYKNKKDEEFLGFIAEEVPDLVAMNGRRGMRAMDIVAVLTKVVQNQQKKNKEYEKLLGEQSELLKRQIKLISELKKRVTELEHK